MALEIGSVLQERYEIVRFIKSGGMGSVCEARDTSLANSPCAIKEVLDHGLNPADVDYIRATFEKEMRALVALDHPCIPKVRDFFEDGDKRYIVMDFLGGTSLDVEIGQHVESTGRGIPPGRAVADVLALLEIVEYLHGLEPALVHRDIKPANIIREEKSGRLKLVDFGLARVVDNHSMQSMVGTWGFCAPEQLAGKSEPASDLYSVGCTLYNMLTGHSPRLSFEPLELELPGLRPGLEVILAKATQPRPQERYKSAREMADDLRAWQKHGTIKGKTLPRIAPKVRTVEHSPWSWSVVAVLALCLGMVGGRALSPKAPSAPTAFFFAATLPPTPPPPTTSEPVVAARPAPKSPPPVAPASKKVAQPVTPVTPRIDSGRPSVPQARVTRVPKRPEVAVARTAEAMPPRLPVAMPRFEEVPSYPRRSAPSESSTPAPLPPTYVPAPSTTGTEMNPGIEGPRPIGGESLKGPQNPGPAQPVQTGPAQAGGPQTAPTQTAPAAQTAPAQTAQGAQPQHAPAAGPQSAGPQSGGGPMTGPPMGPPGMGGPGGFPGGAAANLIQVSGNGDGLLTEPGAFFDT